MTDLRSDGDALTRKMMERSSRRRGARESSSKRSSAASTPRSPAKDEPIVIRTTLHDCRTTQDVGFSVNANNVVTGILPNSPASALDANCRIGDRVLSVDGVELSDRPLAEVCACRAYTELFRARRAASPPWPPAHLGDASS